MSTSWRPSAAACSARRRPAPGRRSRTATAPPTWRPESARACAGCAPTGLTWSRCTSRPAWRRCRRTGPSRRWCPAREQGKVRFLGMSGILPNLPDHIAMGVFDVFQIPYSAVQREHEGLITAAAAAGAGTLIRGGAARGGPAEDKNWRQGPLGLTEGEGERRWVASGVDGLLGDMPRLEFVLRFTLSHPALSSTIVGTSKVDHLQANLAVAAKGPLPADLYEKAKQSLTLAPDN